MTVELLNHTPLHVCSLGIRTCWQSYHKGDNGGDKDKELIDRIGNKLKHKSTLEHLYYNFKIEGISRAVLQELSRHRIASLSVKSSRYTLKELKQEEPFTSLEEDRCRASKYVVFTKKEEINSLILKNLENLRLGVLHNSNDMSKYIMPEAYKTELVWSINARSLQNFLQLRKSTQALWEIRELAYVIYKCIPEEHVFIFKEIMDS